MDSQHWVDVDGQGVETPRAGHVFCAGPDFRAAKTLWVIPEGEQRCTRIVLVRRGHAVGADSGTGRWLRTGGRLFTKGEAYRETDPRSALALDTAKHRDLANLAWRRARARVRPSVEEAFWIKLVNEKAGAGS